MKSRVLSVGLVQAKVGRDKAETVEKTAERVREAARRGAKLVCLQELFASEYFCQSEDHERFALAESIPGPTTEAMAKVAKETGVSIVVPLFERRAAGVYHNSLVIVGPGGETLGMYRKMHIPDDPLFYEKFYFAPGDLGFVAVKTPGATVGPLICWDQWYPEAARLTAMKGAEILAYPTAIGWLPSEKKSEGAAQLDAWKTIQRSHAIANGVFVMAVNRVGQEGDPSTGIEFWGHSLVVDPLGRIVAEAGEE